MSERNFTEDLKVLVIAYLPHIEKITSVEALVLSQCALYLEMNEAMALRKENEIINGVKNDLS